MSSISNFDFSKLQVLIVDDSTTMLNIIANNLKHNGVLSINIHKAIDGIEALKIYQQQAKFDLILTDWNMPRMNGLDFIKEIRKVNKHTPIVMITTEGGKREVISALQAGANNYIVKPFNPVIFKDKIKSVLSPSN